MRTNRQFSAAAACAATLALAPMGEALAVVSAAQAERILMAVNQVDDKVTDIQGEVDGLNDLTQDSNSYLEAIFRVNTGIGRALKTINDTQLAHHDQMLDALSAYSAAATAGEGNAALVGDAYASRAGHSGVDVANAQTGCERGWSARLGGNTANMPKGDGTTTSAAAEIAQELAHTVGERQAANTPQYARALYSVPDAMKTGGQYAAAAAFSEEDLKRLKTLSWLESPKEPANSPVEMAYDGVRYGLARQVQAHWYAGLAPLSKGYGSSRDLASRYPHEALPVVWQDDQALVPAHGLLRAEALSPWYDSSPVDPELSYSGWLLGLDQAGLAREQVRLSGITNRLLYEMLVYGRWDTLLAAQEATRR